MMSNEIKKTNRTKTVLIIIILLMSVAALVRIWLFWYKPIDTEVNVGDLIAFGHYPQSESGKDNTPIQWRVLTVQGDRALLISEYALDAMNFDTDWTDATWESCALRKWLNNGFYNRAFSLEEKRNLANSKVTADENPIFDSNQGRDRTDIVFLLSIREANRYFKDDASRMCAPTDYASKRGAYTEAKNCCWWLRSSGAFNGLAAVVGADGSVDSCGHIVYYGDCGIRPCVWVRIP